MANALYRKLSSAIWARQDGGGPAAMRVQANQDGTFDIYFTYDGSTWFSSGLTEQTQAQAQTTLDNYAASMNAGTA